MLDSNYYSNDSLWSQTLKSNSWTVSSLFVSCLTASNNVRVCVCLYMYDMRLLPLLTYCQSDLERILHTKMWLLHIYIYVIWWCHTCEKRKGDRPWIVVNDIEGIEWIVIFLNLYYCLSVSVKSKRSHMST
jgi:hypothetical protein